MSSQVPSSWNWLRVSSRSSCGRRPVCRPKTRPQLRSVRAGDDVKSPMNPIHWFLNGKKAPLHFASRRAGDLPVIKTSDLWSIGENVLAVVVECFGVRGEAVGDRKSVV